MELNASLAKTCFHGLLQSEKEGGERQLPGSKLLGKASFAELAEAKRDFTEGSLTSAALVRGCV